MASPFNFASSTTATTSQPSLGGFGAFGTSNLPLTSQATTSEGFRPSSFNLTTTTTLPTLGGFSQPKTSTSLLAAELSSTTAGTAVTTSAILKFSTPATGFTSLTTTSTGFSTNGFKPLGLSTSATTTSSALSFPVIPTTSTVASTSAACAAVTTMTYKDLEETVNKWTVEMEAEEQIFLEQATQVNAWDQMLMENGEKISSLNSEVEHLKLDQERLENELDFILSQQRELEDILVPLEHSMEQIPAAAFSQNTDIERERIYKLSECVDSKLKQIASDLKEIVEFLNSSDSSRDTNEPVALISKILNAHMDSLQWIDHSTSNLQHKVENIGTQIERFRKQQELKF